MITVVGIGPGKKSLMLSGTQEIIDKAEIVIGSERQLSLFKVVPAKKSGFHETGRSQKNNL